MGISKRLAALGSYFAVDGHATDGTPGEPWRPMGELLDDPDVAGARVEALRAYLEQAGHLSAGTVRPRVAASVMQLGLAARTLSPVFALAVMDYRQPALGLRDLYWRPTLGSLFALSVPGLEMLEPGECAESVERAAPRGRDSRAAIEKLAGELCEVARPFGVSQRILRGNIASALNGARTTLTAAQPQSAQRAQQELDGLLQETSELHGTAQTTAEGRFQRRSCCLIYQAAPDRKGAVCGDCILAPSSLRRA